MRTCGECTLCCKLPRIPDLDKPSCQWCRHCEVGAGCRAYEERPAVCRDFRCLWLDSDMAEELRPDRVHLLVSVKPGSAVAEVLVDPAFPNAWRMGNGPRVLDRVRSDLDLHAVVVMANQLTFLPASGLPPPEKLVIEWLL